jgi:pyruvate/2-oxoglutarate dehydrogenase complex dihydrolipoamide acyltransferase (E2) component
MGYVINMPKLEQGMQQGLLLEWEVSVGDAVAKDAVLAEIESEKTVSEITARESGSLRRLYVAEGESVAPGTPLGVVADPSESIDSLVEEIDREPVASDEATPSKPAPTADEDRPTEAETGATTGAAESHDGARRVSPRAKRLAAERDVDIDGIEGSGPSGAVVEADIKAEADSEAIEQSADTEPPRATPRARRLAAEEGIDLSSVSGTGPKGSVTATDVETAVGTKTTGPTTDTQSATPDEANTGATTAASSDGLPPAVDTYELSGMRQTIADRLGRSDREAVHVTVSRTVDAEELLHATEIANTHLDVEVSMMDLLLLAVSATLTEHPAFNARFENDTVYRYDAQNVGLAVDIERGLVTPVLEGVESKSLADIVTERRALTEKVLDGEFQRSDLEGGTFTVSNLGVFGVESFDPVINPPQAAILGVTSLREQPVRADDGDGVAFRRHIGFDLSFDHRIVDGADAARALDTLAENVRNPWSLLLDRT